MDEESEKNINLQQLMTCQKSENQVHRYLGVGSMKRPNIFRKEKNLGKMVKLL